MLYPKELKSKAHVSETLKEIFYTRFLLQMNNWNPRNLQNCGEDYEYIY